MVDVAVADKGAALAYEMRCSLLITKGLDPDAPKGFHAYDGAPGIVKMDWEARRWAFHCTVCERSDCYHGMEFERHRPYLSMRPELWLAPDGTWAVLAPAMTLGGEMRQCFYCLACDGDFCKHWRMLEEFREGRPWWRRVLLRALPWVLPIALYFVARFVGAIIGAAT